MKYSILQSAVFAGAAVAAPHLAARQDGERIWESEDGGNVQVTVGTGRTAFGGTPPKETLNAIREGCTSLGCQPNKEYPWPTFKVVGPHAEDQEMKLTIEGIFAKDGEMGDLNQLLQIVEKTFESLHAEGITTDPEEKYLEEGPCPPNLTSCPNDEEKYAKQWYTTDHIVVSVTDEGGKQIGNINITWKIDDGRGDSNLCEDLTGVGSALAGAIPTIGTAAGMSLSLAGLLCK